MDIKRRVASGLLACTLATQAAAHVTLRYPLPVVQNGMLLLLCVRSVLMAETRRVTVRAWYVRTDIPPSACTTLVTSLLAGNS